MATKLQDNSINITSIGLDLDSLPMNIKQGYYRYALNVTNTNDSNIIALTNENKFISKDDISFNELTIIGKSYIDNNKYFIVAVGNTDLINWFIVYNLENRSIENKIQLYEKYYDKLSTVQIVIDKRLGKYYAYIAGQNKKVLKIDINTSDTIVYLNDITIDKEFVFPILNFKVSNGGNLPAGSYSIAIRYLDSDENYTNWIITSNTINVTSSSESDNINSFHGEKSNVDTKKQIIVNIDRIDTNYTYYQLGIIASINGINAPDTIYITEKIPIDVNVYNIYSIDKYIKGDVAEVIFNKVAIEAANAIEKYENRLVLGNIKYKQTDDKSFQLLASKIKSEVVTKTITLNDNSSGYSSKNEYYLGGGFMPGEVYAFGIVYVFNDGSVSNVYHIPAPDNNYGFKAYTINQLYDDWYGTDYDGNQLYQSNVRLHQFPYKDEVGLYDIENRFLVSAWEEREFITKVDHVENPQITLSDGSVVNANIAGFEQTIIYNDPDPETYLVKLTLSYQPIDEGITATSISYTVVYEDNTTDSITSTNITQNITPLSSLIHNDILGIKLSNIQLPDNAVGYIIVYDKKTDNNRHIIDHGYINPLQYNSTLHTHVYSFLDNKYNKTNSTRYFSLHAPEYNYRKLEFKPSKIRVIANVLTDRYISAENIVDDVMDGTSSEGLFMGLIKDDNDGMDYNLSAILNNNIRFNVIGQEYDIDNVFYLRQTEKIFDDTETIVNITLDDQIAVLKTSSDVSLVNSSSSSQGTMYYVALINDNIGYTSLDQIKYIPLGYFESDSCNIWRSDIYFSSWTLSSSVYSGVYSPQNRKIWESASNVIAHVALLGADAAAIAGGVLTGNVQIAYTAAVNSVKNLVGLTIDTYNLVYDIVDKDSSYYEYVFHGAISYPTFSDDTIRFTAETFIGLPVESRFNNQFRLFSEEQTSFFTGTTISKYIDYIKKKHLFHDSNRKPNDDGTVRTLSLRFIMLSELYLYNESYLRINDYKVFSQFNGENTVDFPNRILWSEVVNKEAKQDNFGVFLPLNYKDVEGNIIALKSYNNQLYVWTKEKLLKFPRPFQEKLTNEMQLYIGTGSFLSIGPVETVDDDMQSYGTIYPNTIIKFKGLLAFVNTEGYPILIAGSDIKNLAINNIKKWYSNNRKIRFLEQYYNDKGSDYPMLNPYHDKGVGYLLAYDNINNRLIVTQKDIYIEGYQYEYDTATQDLQVDPEFITYIGFTLSFSLLTSSWISFHSYLPNIYLWTYDIFSYIFAQELYCYDINYWNNYFIIELLTKKNPLMNKVWEDVKVNIDVYKNNNKVFDEFFDNVIFYTDSQVSLRHNIDILNDNQSYLLQKIQNSSNVKAENIENTWRLNNIRDYRVDNNVPVYTNSNIKYLVKDINTGNSIKSWVNRGIIRNNWLIIRLEKNSDNNTKFVINTFVSQYTASIN